MSSIKILRNDVFHALAGINPRKAYGPDGVLPIVLKNCAYNAYRLRPFLLAASLYRVK
ncbi:hypothetical protein E2C01_068007 [Portunus trituberculatus]|uniref:Uncharacterized protein n=1 Tax=Portunus trituberculatus TaxID=210409 RepID=A0A5B7HLB8_PORTR|nr:hypothetical protein [Portunus trituberculatus]